MIGAQIKAATEVFPHHPSPDPNIRSKRSRAMANARPRGRRRVPPLDRFFSKVEKTDTCWLWTGALRRGYGDFSIGDHDMRAHRFAYETFRGPIPDGLVIDHLCRVRNCVNPDHLEPVTDAENRRRGANSYLGVKTHCPAGHPMTPDNMGMKSSRTGPYRFCRICRRSGRA
jgi:hypothetical protein